MKQLQKFLNLTSSDRHLLLYTFVLLSLVRLGLWLFPFQTLWEFLARFSQISSNDSKINPVELEKMVWAVNVSSRYMPGQVKCLAKALTTQLLISQQGYSSQLHIGVVKGETGQIEAHAWVESQSQVVIGNLQDLSRFTPLPLPGSDRVNHQEQDGTIKRYNEANRSS